MMRAHDIMDNWITGRVVIIIIGSNSNERNFIRFGIEVAFQIEHTIHAIPCIDHGWFCYNKGTESGMLNKICLFIWLPISVESNLSIRKKTDKAIKVLLLRPISFWYFLIAPKYPIHLHFDISRLYLSHGGLSVGDSFEVFHLHSFFLLFFCFYENDFISLGRLPSYALYVVPSYLL